MAAGASLVANVVLDYVGVETPLVHELLADLRVTARAFVRTRPQSKTVTGIALSGALETGVRL
ncbi:MAG: hypothetical protein DMG57_44595 [Acidobacteria bacterium]|nr:MAG: hypothetical protein DMG57_44595 [Acidobacteriota bacterium]